MGMLLLMAHTVSAQTVWLDDLNLNAASQGWGQPHKNQSVDGHPLTIAGKTFARGFGTHAESILSVNLDGAASKFSASVGVDDEVNGNPAASVQFIVIGDGKTLWQSGVMHARDAAKQCEVALAGVKSLVLEVENGGEGIDFDHADWAEAKFATDGSRPLATVAGSLLPAEPYVLTPAPPATPRINGANVFGVRPGSPFLFTIPATGQRPMEFLAQNLPPGLKLDAGTGQITGALKKPGRIHGHLAREKCARRGGEEIPHRLRRPDRAHAAAGLEQLELLCRGSDGGAGQSGGGGHGQERFDQPRLDLHQH